jgi:hypothetical protein
MALYIVQKAREAIDALIFSPGSLRTRVWAARWAIHPLTSEPLPNDKLRALFEKIASTIDAGNIPDNTGLTHMKDDAVGQIARDFISFFEQSIAPPKP